MHLFIQNCIATCGESIRFSCIFNAFAHCAPAVTLRTLYPPRSLKRTTSKKKKKTTRRRKKLTIWIQRCLAFVSNLSHCFRCICRLCKRVTHQLLQFVLFRFDSKSRWNCFSYLFCILCIYSCSGGEAKWSENIPMKCRLVIHLSVLWDVLKCI